MIHTTLTICLIAFSSIVMMAQPEKINKEKMQIFSSWAGKWKGESSMQMGPGEPKKSSIEEKIEPKFDGIIFLIEGVGKSIDPQTKQEFVSHHAFAVLSYDQASGQYKFRTYLKDGKSSDSWFTVNGENKFQWGFDIPNRGKTRYSITIDPVTKTWNEIGEFSADGNAWNKFLEMNLTKVE
jgi:hypothetical protein